MRKQDYVFLRRSKNALSRMTLTENLETHHSLRRQVFMMVVGIAFIILSAIALAIDFTNRSVLSSRAFDLLSLGNAASVRQLTAAIDDLPQNLPRNLGTLKVYAHRLSSAFQPRTGLGESGETYLVSSDGQVITESRFTKTPGRVEIPAGIIDHWQGIKNDYRGISCLAIWTKVSFGDFTGYVASEIDRAEVLAPARTLLFFFCIFLVIAFLFTIFVARSFSEYVAWRAQRLTDQMQIRSIALNEGQAKERKRISMELHDDIGQELAALTWKISSVEMPKEQSFALNSHVSKIIEKIRLLSTNLFGDTSGTVDLASSIQQILAECKIQASKMGIGIELALGNLPTSQLDQELHLNILRIVQEAVTNALKHSRGSMVRVSLASASDQTITLSIEDDGCGFTESGVRRGLGLQNMRSRAEAVQGTLEIGRSQMGGTAIVAKFNTRLRSHANIPD